MSTETSSEDRADRRDDDRRDDRGVDRRGEDGGADRRDADRGADPGQTRSAGQVPGGSTDRPTDRGPDRDSGEAGRYTRQHGDHAGQHDHDATDDEGVSVLEPSAAERLRNRWNEVQAGFVDEPRQSVTEADQLVGEVLDEVSRVFRDQRSELEAEWSGNGSGSGSGDGGHEPGTEELRQALRRYREFFDRLLSL